MTRTLTLLATTTVVGLLMIRQLPVVKRLDGSKITAAEIDATVTRLMRAADVTGVSVVILNDGKIVYLKTYGVRDKEKNLPLTEDSVMTGASFTKAAFAYMMMQLVQEGILDLDRPVYEYLPKPLPNYPGYEELANDSRYKQITARMLISHTSGFANLRFLEPDRKLKIHFQPASRYAYSEEGVMLLQLVVEAITKQPLTALMQTRVFQPLGMSRTSMVWEDRFENDFANGYDEYGRSLGPERRKHADAAGSMQTTPRDFAQFVMAIMQGKGLSKKTRDLMLSPQIQISSKHQFPTLATNTTYITITWLTNTAISGARLYWENKLGFFNAKGVSIPVAISVFPDELYPAPRSWAERAFPKLIHYNKVEKGGHFAAWEQPQLLTAELRTAFKSLR